MSVELTTEPAHECGGWLKYIDVADPVRVGDVLVWTRRCLRCDREVRASALISTCPLPGSSP